MWEWLCNLHWYEYILYGFLAFSTLIFAVSIIADVVKTAIGKQQRSHFVTHFVCFCGFLCLWVIFLGWLFHWF